MLLRSSELLVSTEKTGVPEPLKTTETGCGHATVTVLIVAGINSDGQVYPLQVMICSRVCNEIENRYLYETDIEVRKKPVRQRNTRRVVAVTRQKPHD